MVLRAIPKIIFSWNFNLYYHGDWIGEVRTLRFQESRDVLLERTSFQVYREHSLAGAFVLEHAGKRLAQAKKPNAFPPGLFTRWQAGPSKCRSNRSCGRFFCDHVVRRYMELSLLRLCCSDEVLRDLDPAYTNNPDSLTVDRRRGNRLHRARPRLAFQPYLYPLRLPCPSWRRRMTSRRPCTVHAIRKRRIFDTWWASI